MPPRAAVLSRLLLAPLYDDPFELLRCARQLAGSARKLVRLQEIRHDIYIGACAEAPRFVLRHRSLHRVEEILDVLAGPRRHERVERQRRNFHYGIAGEIGPVALLARSSVSALAACGLGVRVDALPDRLLRRW